MLEKVLPFSKDKKATKTRKRGKKEEKKKEIVIKIPVPEIKKPSLLPKKGQDRNLITIRFPMTNVGVKVDEENLYIQFGDVYTKVGKSEIPQIYPKKKVYYVQTYKSQELEDYYVRGRGYLVKQIMIPEYYAGNNKIQTVVEIYIGKFSGKLLRVKFKGGKAYKEGEKEFDKADILVVVKQNVFKRDARSNTQLMYNNVFFRMEKIPEKYAEFWKDFDKGEEVEHPDEEFYKTLEEQSPDQYTVDVEEYEEEEEDSGGSILSKLFRRKQEKEEKEKEDKQENENEEDDDLPDITL